MLFCPTCANVLLVEMAPNLRFCCQTCPYIFNISSKVTRKMPIVQRPIEPVISDKEWDTATVTADACDRCQNNGAKCILVNVGTSEIARFYRCTNTECLHKWKTN